MKIGIGLPNMVSGTRPTVIPEWAAGRAVRILDAGHYRPRGLSRGYGHRGLCGRGGRHEVHRALEQRLARLGVAAGAVGQGGCGHRRGPWRPADPRPGRGGRPDDFVVDGLGLAGRGRRFDRDLAVYRDVWQGELVGGGPNPG